jgi:hypothetical protein
MATGCAVAGSPFGPQFVTKVLKISPFTLFLSSIYAMLMVDNSSIIIVRKRFVFLLLHCNPNNKGGYTMQNLITLQP